MIVNEPDTAAVSRIVTFSVKGKGVEIKEITHGKYGIAQAVMALRINFTQHDVIWWPQGLGSNLKTIETAPGLGQ